MYIFYIFLLIVASPYADVYTKPSQAFKDATQHYFSIPKLPQLSKSYKQLIVVPAYNEEDRLPYMLDAYLPYFQKQPLLDTTFLIIPNNCSDKTVQISEQYAQKYPEVKVHSLKPGGKGFAVKQGFLDGLKKPYDLVGFVDADLATQPEYYYELIYNIDKNVSDGAIASRYKKGARIWPPRPFVRKVGGKIYNYIIRKRLGLPYKDTQCGAKIFTRETIQSIVHDMTEKGWAFDMELLFLCKLAGKTIVEVPTTWAEMDGSHFVITKKQAQEFFSTPKRIYTTHKKKYKQYIATQKKEKRLKRMRKKKKKHLRSSNTI